MLNVAIAVDGPTDYGPLAVRVVAAACEEVIGEQRCPVASEMPPGAVAAWVAVVHPNDRGLSSIRIDFRDRTADGVLIEQRSLVFSPVDSQRSRLVSAGSVIAALAAEREGSLTRTRPPEAPHSPPTSLPRPGPKPNNGGLEWSFDLAAVFAPPLADGPYRLGALGSARASFEGPLFGVLSARYAAHPGDPSFSWWTLSGGVGARMGQPTSSVHFELSGEFVFQSTSVAAEGGADREEAGRSGQSGWGGRAGAAVVWATWNHASLILGVDATFVLPRIHVAVGGQDVADIPLATFGCVLGVRFLP